MAAVFTSSANSFLCPDFLNILFQENVNAPKTMFPYIFGAGVNDNAASQLVPAPVRNASVHKKSEWPLHMFAFQTTQVHNIFEKICLQKWYRKESDIESNSVLTRGSLKKFESAFLFGVDTMPALAL